MTAISCGIWKEEPSGNVGENGASVSGTRLETAACKSCRKNGGKKQRTTGCQRSHRYSPKNITASFKRRRAGACPDASDLLLCVIVGVGFFSPNNPLENTSNNKAQWSSFFCFFYTTLGLWSKFSDQRAAWCQRAHESHTHSHTPYYPPVCADASESVCGANCGEEGTRPTRYASLHATVPDVSVCAGGAWGGLQGRW